MVHLENIPFSLYHLRILKGINFCSEILDWLLYASLDLYCLTEDISRLEFGHLINLQRFYA
jgi:hypothetical protein